MASVAGQLDSDQTGGLYVTTGSELVVPNSIIDHVYG